MTSVQRGDAGRRSRRRGERLPVLGLSLLFLLLLSFSANAQVVGSEGENIVNLPSTQRTVVLPPTRKAEVIDTTFYTLPPGDTLIFGSRITNLHGDGGPLPVEGEFVRPMVLNAEASIGSFISPRGRLALEYAVDRWNARGLLDLRSTAGHVDGAEASGITVDAGAEYQIRGALPSPGNARVSADLRYQGDDYTLYGRADGPLDRTRTFVDVGLGLASETDASFDYAIDIDITSVALGDDTVGFSGEASAMSPSFGGRFRYGDDSLNINASLRYVSTSLDYATPTEGMSFLEAIAMGELSPARGLFISGGVVLAAGDHSDSGSSTLVMPRGGIRYEASRTIGLYARFAPELRAASYRDRILRAPYVDREMPLRPEKHLIDVAGGLRLGFGTASVEGEAYFRLSENTPVVTVTSPTAGSLAYTHRDARTIGVRGLLRATIGEKVSLAAEARLENAVDDETDEQLPMRPVVELRGEAAMSLTEKIGLTGRVTFQGAQNVAINPQILPAGVDLTIGPRFLLDAGATYRIAESFTLFAEITNLLVQSYDWWQGYEAPGIEVRVGGRARF